MRALLLIATLFTSLLATSLQAKDESPQTLLENSITEVIDILHSKDLSLEAKRDQILSSLNKSFSFDIIIRRTLGRNWNRLNESQQESITILITDLLVRAYTNELSDGEKPSIKFVKTDDLGSNKVEVYTTVGYRNNLISVNYRLANITSRGWQVYDILVEGTSLVNNYRSQFDEHFQTGDAEGLLELIKTKIGEF